MPKHSAVQPFQPRHTLARTDDSIIITIPNRQSNLQLYVFGIVFLFTASVSATITRVISEAASVLPWWDWGLSAMLWLFSLYILILFVYRWRVPVTEVIEVTREAIVVRLQGLVFPRSKAYSVEHVRDIRTAAGGFWRAALRFDYGMGTVEIAYGIDEAEAKEILKAIQSRFPQIGISQ